jgi:hypothetical protein
VKVLAVVDVFDRPAIDAVLDGLGYSSRTPVDMLAKSAEALGSGDLPGDLVTTWRTESERAKARAAKAAAPEEKTFWEERARVLDVAVEKKGGCCVTQSTFSSSLR